MSGDLKFNTLPKNPALAESFDVFMCNNFSLPSFAIKFLKEEAESYEARVDDLYVISYPKTGTTWLQQIVYLLYNHSDIPAASTANLHEKFPYIEHARTNFLTVKNMESPRLLKTHLPYSLLPPDIHKKNCKIIYITRNPRDVAVSYFHFARMLTETQYKGTFEQFFERFYQDRTTYSPFLLHNLEFWECRNNSNILFLFYEDMKKNFASNVNKIAKFLGKSLTSDDINAIIKHCSFKSMATNKTLEMSPESVVDKNATFFRKGEVGDWKNYFTQDMIERLDKKITNVLKDSGLEYIYDI